LARLSYFLFVFGNNDLHLHKLGLMVDKLRCPLDHQRKAIFNVMGQPTARSLNMVQRGVLAEPRLETRHTGLAIRCMMPSVSHKQQTYSLIRNMASGRFYKESMTLAKGHASLNKTLAKPSCDSGPNSRHLLFLVWTSIMERS
jgi:hypothetical protein